MQAVFLLTVGVTLADLFNRRRMVRSPDITERLGRLTGYEKSRISMSAAHGHHADLILAAERIGAAWAFFPCEVKHCGDAILL